VARLGRPLEQPVYGCIAVLTRDDPAAGRATSGSICVTTTRMCICSAAISSTSARELAYPVSEVIGYRWPDVG
jgi:hypothetical protein